MSYQKGKPEFVCTLPQSKLDNLIQARKAFENTMSETLKQLNAQISMIRTKPDQNEIQAGELTDQSASRKVQMSSAAKGKGDQTCSDQEKTRNFDLEMNRLKEQLQQRDSEILMLKQEKKVLEEENKKLLEEQKVVNHTKVKLKKAMSKFKEANKAFKKEQKELEKAKALHPHTSGTTQKKIFTADKQNFDQIEPCPLEMPVKPADSGSNLGPSDISLASDCLIGEKLCAKKFVHLVVSQAIEKVSSKYKLFTERLTPDCISDRLTEKIWPEIEKKHLDLSPKRLKNLDKAILKDLCKAHNCKEKHLIFNLREQLDNITVPTFTKKLLSLPRRVLSVSKHREEYKEVVKNVTQDLVMHAMSQENDTTDPGTSDFIIQKLSHKIWNKILSKDYKMSLENIEQLALTVYNELNEKWPSPVFSMKSSSPALDKEIVSSFKKHAKLRSRNIIFRAFSCAR
ncbi:tripartite motif-containing protein 16 [Sarotherodon galilaeus]